MTTNQSLSITISTSCSGRWCLSTKVWAKRWPPNFPSPSSNKLVSKNHWITSTILYIRAREFWRIKRKPQPFVSFLVCRYSGRSVSFSLRKKALSSAHSVNFWKSKTNSNRILSSLRHSWGSRSDMERKNTECIQIMSLIIQLIGSVTTLRLSIYN